MKKALITGSSEGIGHCLAKKLAAEGYQITAVARTESKLQALVQELGLEHCFIVADLSTSQGQDKIAAALTANHYDLLVNNAGVGAVGYFAEAPLDKQMAMTRLNIDALVKLSHAYLKNAKSGDALVNVSSNLAFLPMPGIGLYSATKAFVTSFSEALWFENKSRGVYVMGFCPGLTATNFQVNAGGKKDDVPSALSQTTDEVAHNILKGLKKRSRPTVISGAKNALMAGITRVISRKRAINMMGGMAKKMPPSP